MSTEIAAIKLLGPVAKGIPAAWARTRPPEVHLFADHVQANQAQPVASTVFLNRYPGPVRIQAAYVEHVGSDRAFSSVVNSIVPSGATVPIDFDLIHPRNGRQLGKSFDLVVQLTKAGAMPGPLRKRRRTYCLTYHWVLDTDFMGQSRGVWRLMDRRLMHRDLSA